MDNLLLAQLFGTLAGAVAESAGADKRALAYLRLASTAITAGLAADADLKALLDKYLSEVAQGKEVTIEELDNIEFMIAQNSLAIQKSGS